MFYRDMGEFIARLEQNDALTRITTPVAPAAALAEIAARAAQAGRRNRALVFEQVEGCDFPVAGNLFGTARRMAWALGVDNLDTVADRFTRLLDFSGSSGANGLMQRAGDALAMLRALSGGGLVKHAPAQAVVSDAPDLAQVLSPLTLAESEAQVMTRGANGGRVVERARVAVSGQSRLLLALSPYGSIARALEAAQDEPLPVAVAFGGDPATVWSAGAPLPAGLEAAMLAGWLRGRPVEFARGVSQDVEVPAQAEIVIEGTIAPSRIVPNAPLAIMDITTLTHRADALLVLSPSTPQETRWMAKAAERLFLPLARLVLSEIHDMNVLLDELPGSIVLVSIRQHRHGVAQKVMFGVWGMGDLSLARIVVVVDDDVDVQDTEAVARHVAETVDWTHDAFHVEGMLHPAYGGYGGKMGVDATRKPNRVPRPAPAAPPSLLALLDERWRASRQ